MPVLFNKPSGSVGNVVLQERNGQLYISQNGGTGEPLPSSGESINWINVLDYGAVPDGTTSGGGTDNTTAFQAAISAARRSSADDSNGYQVLYIPAGYYLLRNPLVFPAGLGMIVMGDGEWASVLIIDPATPNGNGLEFNSFAQLRLEKFGLLGRAANPAGKMMAFTYDPEVYASYGLRLSQVSISSHDANLAYDTGIYFDDGPNNSEAQYDNVTIERFITSGVSLPGSQQYGHNFYRCIINGGWDGVDHTANGGLYGINSGGGQFTFRDGNVSNVRGACFYVHASTALACVVDGCDTELAFQIFGDGSTGDIAPGGPGTTSFVYRNSRYSAVQNREMDPDKVIAWNSSGALVVEDNFIKNGDASPNYPTIMTYTATYPNNVSIQRNTLATINSYAHDFVNVLNSTNLRQFMKIRDNTFADSSGVIIAYRNETLNIPVTGTMFVSNPKLETSPQGFWVDLTQFNAAASYQDIEIQSGLPIGITYSEFISQLYNYIVVTGGATITCRVGITSGGQELLKDFTVGGSSVGDWPHAAGLIGALAAERGTNMPGVVGSVTGTSSIWMRLTASAGNLGNGTVSNITRGILHLQARAHIMNAFISP